LGLVRRPNFEKEENSFVAIYDNNMAKISTIGFNQRR